MPSPPDSFGVMLRQLRAKRGLTQAALAELAQVSASYVALIETGRRRPGPAKIAALSTALGCSTEEHESLMRAAEAVVEPPERPTASTGRSGLHILVQPDYLLEIATALRSAANDQDVIAHRLAATAHRLGDSWSGAAATAYEERLAALVAEANRLKQSLMDTSQLILNAVSAYQAMEADSLRIFQR